MKKNYVIIFFCLLFVCSCKKEKNVEHINAEISETISTNFTSVNILSEIKSNVELKSVKVVYSDSKYMDGKKSVDMKLNQGGKYFAEITGLSDSKDYYFYYELTTSLKTHQWGEVRNFATKSYSLPTLKIDSITNVTHESAIVCYKILSDGGATVTLQGVECSNNPDFSDSKSFSGTNVLIQNLLPNTKYYIRAYAMNKCGIGYSSDSTFVTKKVDLEVTPPSQTITAEGGVLEFEVRSNSSWTVSADESWCTLSKNRGTGNASVTVNVASTTISEDTKATITFKAETDDIIRTVTVIRKAGDKTLDVTPMSKTILSGGGIFTIDVTSNTQWTVTSSESWCVLSKSSGFGNATVSVTVLSSISSSDTNSTITFKTNSGVTKTVSVTRKACTETFNVNPLSKTLSSDGGTFNVTVTSNTQWSVTSSATWCSVSKSSGTGNATVTVTVASGAGVIEDDATLTFKTKLGITQKVEIIRYPALSVTPMHFDYTPKSCDEYYSFAFSVRSSDDWLIDKSTLPLYITLDRYEDKGDISVMYWINGKIDNMRRDCLSSDFCSFNVTSGKYSIPVDVNINPCAVKFTADNLIFSAQGGKSFLNIDLGCEGLSWVLGSDVNWIEFVKNYGTGTANIGFNVLPNTSAKSDVGAIYLTIESPSGSEKNITLSVNRSSDLIVTDCQGHTYPVVKIGSQYWMAENLQCTKYDTQSERAGQTLQTSSSYTYAPYYTDGRYATTEYSGNLTQEQRKHLGLLYNWAAAMGYTESQAKSLTGSYSGRRQGICPNGWHLPNLSEWNTLAEYCGGKSNAGGKLKSRSGWYNGGNGTDDYGFSGLPAGVADGSSMYVVGLWGYFWSSAAKSSDYAYLRYLDCYDSNLGEDYDSKSTARSVRCLRD